MKRGRDVKRDKGGERAKKREKEKSGRAKIHRFSVYYQGGGGLKRANISRERQLACVGRSAQSIAKDDIK